MAILRIFVNLLLRFCCIICYTFREIWILAHTLKPRLSNLSLHDFFSSSLYKISLHKLFFFLFRLFCYFLHKTRWLSWHMFFNLTFLKEYFSIKKIKFLNWNVNLPVKKKDKNNIDNDKPNIDKEENNIITNL